MAKKQAETNGAVKSASSVIIEIPIGSDEGGYVPQHVDIQLSPQEGIIVKRIRSAICQLNQINIRGREPSNSDVFRLLLSLIGNELNTDIPT